MNRCLDSTDSGQRLHWKSGIFTVAADGLLPAGGCPRTVFERANLARELRPCRVDDLTLHLILKPLRGLNGIQIALL